MIRQEGAGTILQSLSRSRRLTSTCHSVANDIRQEFPSQSNSNNDVDKNNSIRSSAVMAVTAASAVLVAPFLFGLFRLAGRLGKRGGVLSSRIAGVQRHHFALIASTPFLVYFPAAILGGHTHEVVQTLEDGWTLQEFTKNVGSKTNDNASSSSSAAASDHICQNLLSLYEELKKNEQDKSVNDANAMAAEFGLRARFAKDSLEPVVVHCVKRLEQSKSS